MFVQIRYHLDEKWAYPLFSEISSFVISVIAKLGVKFGLCHFLVIAHVNFVPSGTSTWGQYFTTPIQINGNCESL